jgi:hypothetical protein
VESGWIDTARVAAKLRLTSDEGELFIQELAKLGLLEPEKTPNGSPGFRVSQKGLRLVNWRAIPRMTRSKADLLLSEFLGRCAAIDNDDELTHYVRSAWVFGSYISVRPDLGDLDLLVDIRWRPIPGRDLVAQSCLRAEQSGRDLSFIQRLGYGELEVRKILKSKSPYLSIHDLTGPVASTAERRLIFTSSRF